MTNVMGFEEEVRQLIENAVEEAGNATAFARLCGIEQASLSRYLKGTQGLGFAGLSKIMDHLGISPLALSLPRDPEKYVFIQRALARPATGGGSLETSGETDGTFAFRRDWISSKTSTRPERLRMMTVAGDSMAPTIDDEDVILVDEGEHAQELHEDRIYVIRAGNDIYVKRFRRGIGGKLLFMGDNRERAYQDVTVIPEEENGFAVIGRVLWTGKEL